MSDLQDGILRALRRLTRCIDLYSRQLASRHGLTGPQLVCVRTLARLGPTTPSVLAREMDLSQATITGIVDRLEAQNLVTRHRDTTDRRRVTVGLSEQGLAVAASAPSALHDIFSDRLAQMPESEQRAIHHSLERIVDMMSRRLDPTVPGVDFDGPTVGTVVPLTVQIDANGADRPESREEETT